MDEFERLTNELRQLQKQATEKQWLDKRLTELQSQLDEQEKAVETLLHQWTKEQTDVRQLESLSLTGLFYTILGSKEQQLEKERQEALRAQLRLDEAKQTLELGRYERSQVQHRRSQLEEVEGQLAQKLEKKLQLLLDSNHQVAPELKGYYDHLKVIQERLQEVAEAIQAAKNYQKVLSQLIEQLDSARSWGQWDLIGGGMISSMAKHGHLDDARTTVSSLRHYAKQLQKELADIRPHFKLDLKVSSFDRFADIFFDNLFTDWLVQERINQSLENAKATHRNVHDLWIKLSAEKTHLQSEYESLENDIRLKIINAR